MHIMWFTERQYHYDPETEPERSKLLESQILRNRSFFGLPNANFDAAQGSKLLNEYLDEKIYSEDLGFDGLMLNEHHGTPFCLGSVMDVEAAVLAKATKRAKIVLLGNPVPTVANALRLAEELAMIDLISKGRLVPGWVRGAGSEQLANNANPAYNREYFEEGVDFIIKAWTTPGPFRYEGKHFHFRFVNPWVLPMQKPHPPIWIPGLISPDTVVWCAKKRFPYIALATKLEPTVEMWNIYTAAAAREGYQAGPGKFRLSAAGVRQRQSATRRGTWQAISLRRRVRALRASRVDVPAGLQFERGNPPAGAAAVGGEPAGQADSRRRRQRDRCRSSKKFGAVFTRGTKRASASCR